MIISQQRVDRGGRGGWSRRRENRAPCLASLFLTRASGDLGCGQQRVHPARSEPFQVQGHKLETQGFEDAGELIGHRRVESTRQFIAGDLNANHLPMMPHASSNPWVSSL